MHEKRTAAPAERDHGRARARRDEAGRDAHARLGLNPPGVDSRRAPDATDAAIALLLATALLMIAAWTARSDALVASVMGAM